VRSLSITSQPGGARALLNTPHLDGVALAWLGQAGFALRYGKLRIFLDPYLSDYLERKYRGTNKPHERLMKVPIHTQEVEELDWVLCTHQHSDHMDPDALPILASKSPLCRFIVPRASQEHLLTLGVSEKQIAGIDAGERILLSSECAIDAIPSAHETLEKNERGRIPLLGLFDPAWLPYPLPFWGHHPLFRAFQAGENISRRLSSLTDQWARQRRAREFHLR
jgi:Beta-lactamase superfamily domain